MDLFFAVIKSMEYSLGDFAVRENIIQGGARGGHLFYI
jgi:hypothetical protein